MEQRHPGQSVTRTGPPQQQRHSCRLQLAQLKHSRYKAAVNPGRQKVKFSHRLFMTVVIDELECNARGVHNHISAVLRVKLALQTILVRRIRGSYFAGHPAQNLQYGCFCAGNDAQDLNVANQTLGTSGAGDGSVPGTQEHCTRCDKRSNEGACANPRAVCLPADAGCSGKPSAPVAARLASGLREVCRAAKQGISLGMSTAAPQLHADVDKMPEADALGGKTATAAATPEKVALASAGAAFSHPRIADTV